MSSSSTTVKWYSKGCGPAARRMSSPISRTYCSTTRSGRKTRPRRSSPFICRPRACSSCTESVPQPWAERTASSAAGSRSQARVGLLEEIPRIGVAELAQRVGHVADDQEHGAVEGGVVDDRHAVAFGELEEVILDLADRLEVLEVAMRGPLLRADRARGKTVAKRGLVEAPDHQEDHVGGVGPGLGSDQPGHDGD